MKPNRKTAIIVGALILIAYGVLVSIITQSKIPVMIADVISGFAVIGIAVLIFPFFKISNKLRITYLSLKIVEGTLMVIGGILFLINSSMRDWIYSGIHLYVFIVSAFIFYYLLYKSKIVPRFISVWGAIAIFSLLLITILNLINFSYPPLEFLLILIITNEVFLAIWLMIKGFNLSAINSKSTKTK
ncbi:MAG: DUF4386 domain-containing protein [Nanoarchaeota archaeon]